MASQPALIKILLDPPFLPRLEPAEQTLILRQARQAGLLGYIEARIGPDAVSGKLADHLLAAKVHADYHDQMISWETDRLGRILGELRGPVILLKGAAYKALELALSQGRLASDVDLLLPREQLPEAERLLLSSGWEALKEDEYEQHYYREWMHELPPLRHRERGTVVDLHHTILPPTARLRPDPAKLIAAAVPLHEGPFFTLCPEDAVIHRAVHLFYDGDLQNSLRELVDIHELICAYAGDQTFLPRLIDRSRELDLARPLFYALHFCHLIMETDITISALNEARRDAPPFPIRPLTLWLIETALRARDPDRPGWQHPLAEQLLFLRSHWLRMPPLLLARHLLTQVWRRGGVRTG